MKANDYKVLVQAIEAGVAYGWIRAHKHDANPTPNAIQVNIEEAVLNEVCEWFDFDSKAQEEQ